MTSLQASLPASASGLWRMDREYGISQSRVKHIVIHEAHIRDNPDRHVVYRVDVFTTERNWCVYRRYSEFRKLHDKISSTFKMFKGTFPPKVISGNLTPTVVEQRRSALEHYLLKIITCHNIEVATCNTLLRFLDLHRNDVYYVTSGLCRHIKIFGEAILNEEHAFVLTPTQLFCIHKRLRIPNNDFDIKADSIFCDLSSLYDFLGRLGKLYIKPSCHQDNNIRTDLSLLKNLKELQILSFPVTLLKGLSTIQLQLQRLKVTRSVSAMRDILIDSVLEKKAQPKPPKPTESFEGSWRAEFNLKAVQNAFTIHPWISLLYLDLSRNNIKNLDDSFSLLPNLQELDISYNEIHTLDLNHCNPSLTKIVCTSSGVKKVITKLHENLSQLVLDNNQLVDVQGYSKLVVLKHLSLRANGIVSVDDIVPLTELPRLHQISFLGCPLAKQRTYRQTVLCLFTQACRRDDIVLDDKGFTDKEKRKAKSTRIKGTAPLTPSSLPFFGSSSDHVPTAFKPPPEPVAPWNSILHGDEYETTSESGGSGVGEDEDDGVLSAGGLMDIRSTPSQPRTYDWDPAEAFAASPASSFPSTSVNDITSPPPSSSYVDYTSSCDDLPAKNLNQATQNPDSSSIKDFNSNYYSLSGSAELYSKMGTSPGSGSKAPRTNPFTPQANTILGKGRSDTRSEPETDTLFVSCRDPSTSSSVISGGEAAAEADSAESVRAEADSGSYDNRHATIDTDTDPFGGVVAGVGVADGGGIVDGGDGNNAIATAEFEIGEFPLEAELEGLAVSVKTDDCCEIDKTEDSATHGNHGSKNTDVTQDKADDRSLTADDSTVVSISCHFPDSTLNSDKPLTAMRGTMRGPPGVRAPMDSSHLPSSLPKAMAPPTKSCDLSNMEPHDVSTAESRDLSTVESHDVSTAESRDLSNMEPHDVSTAESRDLSNAISLDQSTVEPGDSFQSEDKVTLLRPTSPCSSRVVEKEGEGEAHNLTTYTPSPERRETPRTQELNRENRLCSLSLGDANITIDDLYDDDSSEDSESDRITFANAKLQL